MISKLRAATAYLPQKKRDDSDCEKLLVDQMTVLSWLLLVVVAGTFQMHGIAPLFIGCGVFSLIGYSVAVRRKDARWGITDASFYLLTGVTAGVVVWIWLTKDRPEGNVDYVLASISSMHGLKIITILGDGVVSMARAVGKKLQ